MNPRLRNKVPYVFVGLLLSTASSLVSQIHLTPETVVEFADVNKAAAELSRKDSFVESLSAFDRAARMKTDQQVSLEIFLNFVSEQAQPWPRKEIERLTRIIGSISNKVENLHLRLPASIRLVKTTGKEEGGAAYCRRNSVILPAKQIDSTDESLERLLTHELFHILSRNDRNLRDALYAIIGFKRCGAVAYPRELEPRRITNPDAPVVEHYMTVTFQNKPTSVVPILFANAQRYDPKKGGEFFACLKFKLLVIEHRGNRWIPVYHQRTPRLLDVNEVQEFYEQVGRNTDYLIHPEEILADNLVLLVQGDKNVATPKILSEMRRVLSRAPQNNFP